MRACGTARHGRSTNTSRKQFKSDQVRCPWNRKARNARSRSALPRPTMTPSSTAARASTVRSLARAATALSAACAAEAACAECRHIQTRGRDVSAPWHHATPWQERANKYRESRDTYARGRPRTHNAGAGSDRQRLTRRPGVRDRASTAATMPLCPRSEGVRASSAALSSDEPRDMMSGTDTCRGSTSRPAWAPCAPW